MNVIAPLEETLTRRERVVLACIANGDTTEEAAERLRIGCWTVKSHLRGASRKLGTRSRSHAVAVAFRRGILS